MATIDTRHEERNVLFLTLVAQYNNDFDTLLSALMAKMEKEDVQTVKEMFEDWKNTRK